MATVGANVVRQHRLIALAAVLDLRRGYVMVAPPMALLGM
jgi:hypothetical protein